MMSGAARGLIQNAATSLVGSIVPALIGLGATLIVGRSADRHTAAAVLLLWSILGYLSLADLGLTRSASRLVSGRIQSVAATLGHLWPASVSLGFALGLVVGIVLALIQKGLEGVDVEAAWIVVLVPLLSSIQFPIVGALEGLGKFRLLSAQRVLNAIFTYLLPSLLTVLCPHGFALGLILLVAYRLAAVVWLWRATGAKANDLRSLVGTIPESRARDRTRGSFWLGVSSVLGALFLYLDRVVLFAWSPSIELWVLYVTISEVLLRTYLLPTAVLSVVFPWIMVNLDARLAQIRRVVVGWGPAGTALAAVGGSIIAWAGAPHMLSWLNYLGTQEWMRWMITIAVFGTVVNWSSQFYVAFLQAVDRYRLVVIVQAGMLLPYVILSFLALSTLGVLGLTIVWAARILVFWAVLAICSGILAGRLRTSK